MLKSLKELFRLLDPVQRRRLVLLQGLVILMSFAELVGVISIGPFMALVGNLDQLQGDGLLARVYRDSGATSEMQFVFWAGAVSLSALAASALVSTYTLWRLTIYGQLVGAQLGNRLFAHYLAQPWLFHASGNSSQLVNKISQEAHRVTLNVIDPFMRLNAKAVLAVIMGGAILIYNPTVAMAGIGLFTAAYWGLYRMVRPRLARNGQKATAYQAIRFKLMSEGFGGIKDTLLLGRQKHFIDRFDRASLGVAEVVGHNQVIGQVPRYAVELVAFGAAIALVMYLVLAHQGDTGAILPALSIYALAGMKLLPAFQQIYTSVAMIRGALPSFENVRHDLKMGLLAAASANELEGRAPGPAIAPRQDIELRNIRFRYPTATKATLDGLSLRIPAHAVVGLVGPSGSGKSTAIDVLMALVDPDEGELLVDGSPITATRRRAWQDSIGFVAQSIFLADSSIKENIAFGMMAEAIDNERVLRAAHMAHLSDLLADLPDGPDTLVGERGVQLSGGQRQRIGIARALYHDPPVLVFDEATSSLDGITEKMVMEAIHDFGGTKTIVMVAHRLATVKKCDWIYMIEQGRVVDQGTYGTLIERNPAFRQMAE